MKKYATSPADVWKEYQQGVSYNLALGLYETVNKNENFYIGKQWKGVNARRKTHWIVPYKD